MNINKWNEIYENNQRLDQIFVEKYKDDKRLFEKNCIELLVEIGEFVNETKIFKYWSIKKPNKDKMLEEYADVITMILTFYGLKNMKIKKEYKYNKSEDLLELVHKLYKLVLELKDNFKESVLEEIFSLVIYIGKKLNFIENEVLEAIQNKQMIIEKRLNSDY